MQPRTPAKVNGKPVSATEGLREFLAQQRRAPKQSHVAEKEAPVRTRQVMTGRQQYTSNAHCDRDEAFGTGILQPSLPIKAAIAQAKHSGKLSIGNNGLQRLPEEVLTMYHVDPHKIVVDFSSSAGAWYDEVELTKLLANDNQLVEVDARLGEAFGALAVLDFRNNRLQALPSTLALLKHLTVLHLPHNAFETVPDVLLQMSQLRELDMSHNQLTCFPSGLGQCLEILLVGNNQLTALPVLGPQLRRLHANANQLTALPEMKDMVCLEELRVSENRLRVLLQEGRFPQLTRVDARHNALEELSQQPQPPHLPKLLELFLSHNQLGQAHLRLLQGAPCLQTLDVSWNDLNTLPEAVFQLETLKRLDLGSNRFMTLPVGIGRLPQLEVVTWEGNLMRSIPKGTTSGELIGQLRAQWHAIETGECEEEEGKEEEEKEEEKTDTALLGGSAPVQQTPSKTPSPPTEPPYTGPPLPAQSQRSITAKTLDLAQQNLHQLPAPMLLQLTYSPINIQLQHNALSVFPASLGCFATTLVNLHLQFNALQDISLSIDALVLPCLKALNLSNNSMKTLTAGTHCSFPCLEELHLSHNHLVDLPDTLATCLPRLRVLKVDNNRLVTLRPKCFDHLEILDLGFNAIDDVPPELGLVHTLKELTLYGNSFRVPRPALLDQGTKAVMEFLSRRAT